MKAPDHDRSAWNQHHEPKEGPNSEYQDIRGNAASGFINVSGFARSRQYNPDHENQKCDLNENLEQEEHPKFFAAGTPAEIKVALQR